MSRSREETYLADPAKIDSALRFRSIRSFPLDRPLCRICLAIFLFLTSDSFFAKRRIASRLPGVGSNCQGLIPRHPAAKGTYVCCSTFKRQAEINCLIHWSICASHPLPFPVRPFVPMLLPMLFVHLENTMCSCLWHCRLSLGKYSRRTDGWKFSIPNSSAAHTNCRTPLQSFKSALSFISFNAIMTPRSEL